MLGGKVAVVCDAGDVGRAVLGLCVAKVAE